MVLKLARTKRFDQSDAQVFEQAAGEGEWAVPGGFSFAHLGKDEISGKRKQAFANGFLSLESLGRATFVTAAEADDETVALLEEKLARHFVESHGAPDIETALPVARDEIGFCAELCLGLDADKVLTVRRFFDEAGEIREEFRIIDPPCAGGHSRAWEIVED